MDHFQSSFAVRAIARFLAHKLPGYFLTEAFSTGKDELLLEFESRTDTCTLKLNWADGQMFISMPEQPGRSGKNTINQFRDAVGQQVSTVHDCGFDRSFRIEFSNHSQLVFKCWGKHSNVLFYEAGETTCSQHFRLHHKGDVQLSVSVFTGIRSFEYERAACSDPELFQRAYPFVGASMLDYLLKQGFFRASESERQSLFADFKAGLENPQWHIGEPDGMPVCSFFPVPGTASAKDLPEALNHYVKHYLSWFHFRSKKQQLLGFWKQETVRLSRFLEDLQKEYKRLQERPGYRLMGDLIMAHAAEIADTQKELRAQDFEGNQWISIRLNPELNAFQNAEMYYRKARNESKEAALVSSRLKSTAESHQMAMQWLQKIEAAQSSKDLRDTPLPEKKGREQHTDLPFHEFSLQGFVVWVGKHAKANELLLNSYSRKNDVWLHARDVSGSHVLIRTVHGTQGLPKTVLEQAAALAAWFSKGKTQGWLPVQYTERKYVRKRKGGAPGEVLVEKEKVLIVQPGLPG